MRHFLDHVAHGLRLPSGLQQGKAEQDGDEENGDDEILVGQRADQRVGNDLADELQRGLALGFCDVALRGRKFGGAAGVVLEAIAGLENIGDDDADEKCEGRDDLEIENGAATKFAD